MKRLEYSIPASLLIPVIDALRRTCPHGYGGNGRDDHSHLAEMLYLIVKSQDGQTYISDAEVAQKRKLLDETRQWKVEAARG